MTPAGTSNELDVQNEWEENTHTHLPLKVLYTILYCSILLVSSNTSNRLLYSTVSCTINSMKERQSGVRATITDVTGVTTVAHYLKQLVMPGFWLSFKLFRTRYCVCVCVCVVMLIILDVRLVDVPCVYVCCHPNYSGRQTCGRTSRGHRISPPSFCGTCLNFSREKISAVPFPRRP